MLFTITHSLCLPSSTCRYNAHMPGQTGYLIVMKAALPLYVVPTTQWSYRHWMRRSNIKHISIHTFQTRFRPLQSYTEGRAQIRRGLFYSPKLCSSLKSQNTASFSLIEEFSVKGNSCELAKKYTSCVELLQGAVYTPKKLQRRTG